MTTNGSEKIGVEQALRKTKKESAPRLAKTQRQEGSQASGAEEAQEKGDRSKNAKMAAAVVMYTLRRGADGLLEGPINKKVYASYAPKRHAFAYARREADKRGICF